MLYSPNPDADQLTGFMTQDAFIEAIGEVHDPQAVCSMALIDIDDLTSINVASGVQSGDTALVELAQRIRRYLRTELVGRARTEFMIFAPSRRARAIATSVVKAARAPIKFEDMTLEITVSAGVVVGPDHGVTTAELMDNVRHALEQAKKAGKDRVYVPPRRPAADEADGATDDRSTDDPVDLEEKRVPENAGQPRGAGQPRSKAKQSKSKRPKAKQGSPKQSSAKQSKAKKTR